MPRSDAQLRVIHATTGAQPSAAVGPSVSVVICAYTEDRWDDLQAAIRSVQQQRRAAHELVVVIDYNPTLLGRIQAVFPDLTVIENAEARGISGARNTGVAAASGDVVAFLDDDATADPDWLARLSDAYLVDGVDDHRVLGVGGTITPRWDGGRPGWFPEELDWVVGCTYRGMSVTTAPVRNLIGANMSFRREVFAATGGFRRELGRIGAQLTSCEETEFSIRVRQQFPGGRLMHEPRARVLHRVPARRGSWSYLRSRCYAEGCSKAMVSALAGSDAALSTERAYVLRTLPQGVARALVDLAVHRDRSAAGRATAIVAGLAVTTAGYAVTMMAGRSVPNAPATAPLRSPSDVSPVVATGPTPITASTSTTSATSMRTLARR